MLRLGLIAFILAAAVSGVRALDAGRALHGSAEREMTRIEIPQRTAPATLISSVVLPPREHYPEIGPARADAARPTIRPMPRVAEAMIAADAQDEPTRIAPEGGAAPEQPATEAERKPPANGTSRDIAVPRLGTAPAPATTGTAQPPKSWGTPPTTDTAPRMSAGPSVRERVAADLRPPGNDPGRSTVIRTGADVIRVESGKGALVRLPSPAATVFIANPDYADVQVKTSTLIYVFGKAAGETVLYAVDEDENVVLGSALQVTHNLSGLQRALMDFYPQNRIDVSASGNALMLSGVVDSPEEVANAAAIAARYVPNPDSVINNIKVVAPNQVNLRVRVAEVSRGDLKRLGINWDALGSIGNFVFGLATGLTTVAGDTPFPANDSFLVRRNGANSFVGGYSGNNLDVNGVIDALQTEGLISVLAEPNLTALSGETASFLAGGEFPIPVSGDRNDEGIRIQFKEFGVSLAFTPTILTPARINLHVRPEVSQLSDAVAVRTEDGIFVPGLLTRRAETTVELGSGQSFAIAGLLQNDINQNVEKVPLLGDIPILGRLFRSEEFQKNETELVIIVTPYVVRPSSGPLAAPTDGFVPSSDAERFATGAAYRPQVQDTSVDPVTPQAPRLVGPAGFILE